MSIHDIAADFAALCKKGAFEDAGQKYWSDDVVSIEAMEGPMARVEGRKAVQGKSDWWYSAHEIHSVEAAGPYVNGNQFVLRFTMDVTNKESGQRSTMDELGVYTVQNGKVVEERFFYGA